MKKYENGKNYFREKIKLIYDHSTLGMKSVDLRRCHKLLPIINYHDRINNGIINIEFIAFFALALMHFAC